MDINILNKVKHSYPKFREILSLNGNNRIAAIYQMAEELDMTPSAYGYYLRIKRDNKPVYVPAPQSTAPHNPFRRHS